MLMLKLGDEEVEPTRDERIPEGWTLEEFLNCTMALCRKTGKRSIRIIQIGLEDLR